VHCLPNGRRFDPESSDVKLTNIVIETRVVTYGSTVAEAFSECVRCNVLGIPFVDGKGRITGRFSIGHTIKLACIPDILIMNADLLGDQLDTLMIPDKQAADVLRLPVDNFILGEVVTIHSSSPCVKAAALMQKHRTTYLFAVDDDGYKGVVNVRGIAKRMLDVGGF
jgi:CBS domain-containing protein